MKLYKDRDWLYKKYWKEMLLLPEIANLCKCSNSTVCRWIKRHRIKARTNSEAQKISKNRPEFKERRRKLSKKLWLNLEYRKKTSKAMKQLWTNPEYVKKILKARKRRPSKPEKMLDKMTPLCICYVGNRAWWRKLNDGKYHNPDFKVTGQNKIIEVFGDYWHRNDDPQKLIDLYAQVGLDCLIFWESEIYNYPNEVIEKVDSFIKS